MDLDTSKAKLEAKYKEAEKRRNSLLKTRNTRLKKELDEVITKTAQVRKQLEEENALCRRSLLNGKPVHRSYGNLSCWRSRRLRKIASSELLSPAKDVHSTLSKP